MSNDDWVPFNKESTDRRNDPELKAKVAKVVRARQKALREASELLKQAADIISAQSHFTGDAIYDHQVTSVRIANFTLRRDADFAGGITETGRNVGNPAENENYLGNLAAGTLGIQIQSMGDKFPL